MGKRMVHRGKKPVHGGFLGTIWRFFGQKFTVMLIPHTEKRPVNLHISLLALLVVFLLFIGLLVGFFWFSLDFSGKDALLATQSQNLSIAEASLDIMREEVGQLISSAERFRISLKKTVEILGIEDNTVDSTAVGGGDLASLLSVEQADVNASADVADLQKLRVSLDSSVGNLEDIGRVLSGQKDLLSDIPTIWPLKDVRGWVTQVFGPSIHPFGYYWYLHRGVDMAFGYGVPILATANGKVVKKDFDTNGFGYYIDVQHGYGFKTRYAHLQRQLVEVGQQVTQGEIIGTMGNSGLSTGPHLHYEVMIGTQLVDPIKFLNMTDNTMGNYTSNLKRYQ